MAHYEQGHLYIIKSEEGPVKIGISIDPHNRIVKLSATSGRGIVRKFVSPIVPHSANIERALHDTFSASRTYGEWFDVDFDEAVRAAHHLGARLFPNEWKQSTDYAEGAIHRDRMRLFAKTSRTALEWDAFFAGMGDLAKEQAELADDVDMQAAVIGMARLQLIVDAAGDQPEAKLAAMAIGAALQVIRSELDADMVAAGLK